MISTLVLPELIRLMGDEVPPEIRKAAKALRHVSVRCVNLGVNRDTLTDKHWIYYAGKTVFHRIFVQGNASPFCSPPGACGLTCEISYSPDKPLPADGQALIDRCIQECIEVGIISETYEILTSNQIDIPYAYVIYDQQRKENVEMIRKWLLLHGITLAGRYSEWEYYNSTMRLSPERRRLRKFASLRTATPCHSGDSVTQRNKRARNVPSFRLLSG